MKLDLNYHHLFYFWTCAKAGRVTLAARELGLSQSALSLQLRSLERAVGRPLFERTRTGLELTACGKLVFAHCEPIFAHGAALSAALRDGGLAPAVIRLGVSSALGREVAMTFIDRLSAVERATVTVYVGPRDDVRERLARRRLDIGVVGVDLSDQLGSAFRCLRVGMQPVSFYAAPALARSLRGFPRDGQEVPMLFRTQEISLRRDVEAFLRARGVRPMTVAESEDSDLLRSLALRGRGVVALHEPAARADLAAGRLARVGPVKTGLMHQMWVVTPAQGALVPALQKAVELVNRA